MKLNILHLADLHCNADDELYLKNVGVALCQDVVNQAAAGIKPDIICVTGDLVNKGQNATSEYALAESLFLNRYDEHWNFLIAHFSSLPETTMLTGAKFPKRSR